MNLTRPILSLNQAEKFLKDLHDKSKGPHAVAGSPADLKARIEEANKLNWKSRGFKSMEDYIARTFSPAKP